MLALMVGQDPSDATSLQFPELVERARRATSGRLRLGVPGELTGEGIEAGVLAAFRASLATAESLGAEVLDVQPPARAARPRRLLRARTRRGVLQPGPLRRSPLRAARGRGRAICSDMYTRTRHDGFGPEVKRRIMLGTYALSSGYYDAYYGRAQRVRTKIAEDFAKVFGQVDFIVTPTAPTVAFALGEKTGDPLAMYLNDFCTVPMSLAGHPSYLDSLWSFRRAAGWSADWPGRPSARTACSTPPMHWR